MQYINQVIVNILSWPLTAILHYWHLSHSLSQHENIIKLDMRLGWLFIFSAWNQWVDFDVNQKQDGISGHTRYIKIYFVYAKQHYGTSQHWIIHMPHDISWFSSCTLIIRDHFWSFTTHWVLIQNTDFLAKVAQDDIFWQGRQDG